MILNNEVDRVGEEVVSIKNSAVSGQFQGSFRAVSLRSMAVSTGKKNGKQFQYYLPFQNKIHKNKYYALT